MEILAHGRKRDSATIDLRLTDRQLRVSPQLAKTLLSLYPTLADHACKGSKTGFFGARIVGALLPHAVEHVAIEILLASQGAIPAAGYTCWANREEGVMRVCLRCAKPAGSHQDSDAGLGHACELAQSPGLPLPRIESDTGLGQACESALIQAVRLITGLIRTDKNHK
jgi:hypothetical protein